MSSPTPSRPAQATFAVGLIVGGSLLAIVTAWERISGLHSIEAQESLARIVADQPLGSMSVSTLATVLRVLCVIGGGAAAAAAIMAGQVPRRSRSARVVLTCLAPLVFVGWLGTSGFFEPLVLAGIAMLWLPPTTDWYAGREWAPRARPGGDRTDGREGRPDPFAPPSTAPTPPSAPAPSAPAPPAPPTSPTSPTSPPPVPGQRWPLPPPPPVGPPVLPPGGPSWQASAYPPLARRPRALVAGCAVTWICSALTAVGLLGAIVWLTTSGDAFVARVLDREQQMWGSMADGITANQIKAELFVLLVLMLLWCLVAIGLAVLAFHGRSWARVVLVVSAGVAGVCALLGSGSFPPLLVDVVGSVVAVVQLVRRDAAGWRPPR